MGKLIERAGRNARTWTQFCFTALTNGYAAGFFRGKIYKGPTKLVCVPGLNCYSCPGALGACPVGSFQAVLAGPERRFPFYVAGFLMLFGALLGRFVCGWLCPFGLVQDLVHKIPSKKLRRLPGERWLRYLRYAVLAVFVVILPAAVRDIVGQGAPWFCKYICPSGTLFAGLPLAAANPGLRQALGRLFTWKAAVLTAILALSVFVSRPFCRYLCPLGAVYGMFNPIAFYRFRIDGEKCMKCGLCQKTCRMDIPVYLKPNSADCIRCGDCVRACPSGAVCPTVRLKKKAKEGGPDEG